MSVGFLPLPNGSHWDYTHDKPWVDRSEARFLETSLCSVPVYADAGMLSMRSMGVPDHPETRVVPTPRKNEFAAWLASVR